MSFFNSIVNLFGTKSGRDLKKLSPLVLEINKSFSHLKDISNDDLRNKTIFFQNLISDSVSLENKELDKLKQKVVSKDFLLNPDDSVYEKIDNITQSIYKKKQKVIDDIKVDAFAVIKETARRFSNNDTIITKCLEFDRILAEKKDYIIINAKSIS